MFGKGKDGHKPGITLVANNCEMVGDVYFSDQLLVNGIVKGNILAQEGSKATVTVSERGRVKGDIRVPNVIVNGKVYGDVYSDKHIELAAKAEVKGNVYYNLIEMVMGSRVDGNLVHMKDGKMPQEKPAPTQAERPPVPSQPERAAAQVEKAQRAEHAETPERKAAPVAVKSKTA